MSMGSAAFHVADSAPTTVDQLSPLRTFGRGWIQRHGRRAHQALSEALTAHDPAFSLRWEPLPASGGLAFRLRLTRDGRMVLSYRLQLIPESSGLTILKHIGTAAGHEPQVSRFRGRAEELTAVPALDWRDLLHDIGLELHRVAKGASWR